MIQYGNRIGFITREVKGKLDLFLLPNGEFPSPELALGVAKCDVTLAKIPQAMNEITGLDRLAPSENAEKILKVLRGVQADADKDAFDRMLGGAHVVQQGDNETREEALTRGRKEIATPQPGVDEIDTNFGYGKDAADGDDDKVL